MIPTSHIHVADPRRVIIEGFPDDDPNQLCMSLTYNSELWLGAFRHVHLSTNAVGRVSDITLVHPTTDPFVFTLGKTISNAEADNVLGYEDPSFYVILSGSDRHLAIASTQVCESTRYYKGGWEANLTSHRYSPTDQGFFKELGRPFLSHDDGIPWKNISYVKELEQVEFDPDNSPTQIFCEVGGPGLGSFIANGDITNRNACLDRVWMEPNPKSWDSTHLSTGPIIPLGNECWAMFYNGRGTASHEQGEWAIGLVVFKIDQANPYSSPEILYRSSRPMIRDLSREQGYDQQIICFSSGIRSIGANRFVLYAHIGDNYIVGYELEVRL